MCDAQCQAAEQAHARPLHIGDVNSLHTCTHTRSTHSASFIEVAAMLGLGDVNSLHTCTHTHTPASHSASFIEVAAMLGLDDVNSLACTHAHPTHPSHPPHTMSTAKVHGQRKRPTRCSTGAGPPASCGTPSSIQTPSQW
jgi:hypothetical protein